MKLTATTLALIKTLTTSINAAVDPILYCDLCKAVIAETRVKISKVDPNKKTRIVQGQGRLSSKGELKTKSKLIPVTQSKEWLEEVFEEQVCGVIAEDYVKWFDGEDKKQWRVGRIMTHSGAMNTNIDLGFLQTGMGEAREVMEKDPNDRSRTIRWYCENAIEIAEDQLYDAFTKVSKKPSYDVCYKAMSWCGEENSDEDFEFPVVEGKKDEL